jgi:PAS domain S-box-containing protein
MKIKTRLRLNTFISLGVIILILFSFVWSLQEVSRASRNLDLVAQMRRVVFDRVILRDDYLLYQEDRARIQWNAKSETLKELFKAASKIFTDSQDKALLEVAQEQFNATLKSFVQFMEEHKGEQSSSIKGIHLTEAESMLISQVFLKAYALRDSLDRLHASAEIARNTAMNKGILAILLSIIGGFFLIIINSTVISRKLTTRIAVLSKGVEIIGAGDLDYRIEVEGNDELAALALANNEMAAKLKNTHTSLDRLEKEINRHKLTEEQLRKTSTYLDNLISNANTPIIVWDPQLRITRCNHAFEKLTGRKAEDVIGHSPEFLLPSDQIETSMALINKTLRGERWENVEISILHVDGSVHIVLWNFATLFSAVGKTPVATIAQGFDITARKQAESMLELTVEDLRRSNKDLEQFAYVASHDLQEPLRMVASYTQLLAQRYQDQLDDRARKYINYAVDGAVRMQLLINDLLAYSRIGTRGKQLELTDAHAVLGEAINNLKMNIDEAKAIITNDELPKVRADASQFVQLFQNLISNAVKFREDERPHVHISARDEGREWLFSVRDNGIGIDRQHADKVFVIFQRLHTKEKYPGSGMGLAICKKIVDRHSGRIWFESEIGKGTTFYFTIPK